MSEIMDTLRAAARACKLELFQGGNPIEDELDNGLLYIDASGVLRCWNPFDDDTDAFRLAIRLNFEVSCWGDGQCYVRKNGVLLWNEFAMHAESEDERRAAMRRTIARAAAGIGRALEVTA